LTPWVKQQQQSPFIEIIQSSLQPNKAVRSCLFKHEYHRQPTILPSKVGELVAPPIYPKSTLFYVFFWCEQTSFQEMVRPGNTNRRGRVSTVCLLVLTSLDRQLLQLKIMFYLFYKTRYLNEEVNCTEPSPSASIPWLGQ